MTFFAQHEYQLERWSLNGARISSFHVEGVPWLPAEILYENRQVTGRGETRIVSMPVNLGQARIAGIDAEGLVWLNVTLPASGTATARRTIDVFDPASGTVLASVPTTLGFHFVHGSSLAWSLFEEADGAVTYAIWSITLRRN
jgi:hypothetical protein